MARFGRPLTISRRTVSWRGVSRASLGSAAVVVVRGAPCSPDRNTTFNPFPDVASIPTLTLWVGSEIQTPLADLLDKAGAMDFFLKLCGALGLLSGFSFASTYPCVETLACTLLNCSS